MRRCRARDLNSLNHRDSLEFLLCNGLRASDFLGTSNRISYDFGNSGADCRWNRDNFDLGTGWRTVVRFGFRGWWRGFLGRFWFGLFAADFDDCGGYHDDGEEEEEEG